MTLTSAELSWMRSTLADLRPGTAYILSGTSTSDGAGEIAFTWGTVGTATCRIDPMKSREQLTGDGIQLYNQYMITLPYDTTVSVANRLVIGTVTYAVVSVMDNESWNLDKRLQVERI